MPVDRDSAGRYELQRLRCNLLHQLHVAPICEESEYYKYDRSARNWRKLQTRAIADSVGDGVCGLGSASELVVSASAFAMSKLYFDKFAATGDTKFLDAAVKLDAVRAKTLRAAYEYAGAEATAREKQRARKERPVDGTVEPSPLDD
ncbi:MAG: hypothetical protein IPK60_21135 [Sandaracinaceae bacterium]|nr:hypothetical protein [Sandaracinaceae bacterium]